MHLEIQDYKEKTVNQEYQDPQGFKVLQGYEVKEVFLGKGVLLDRPVLQDYVVQLVLKEAMDCRYIAKI